MLIIRIFVFTVLFYTLTAWLIALVSCVDILEIQRSVCLCIPTTGAPTQGSHIVNVI